MRLLAALLPLWLAQAPPAQKKAAPPVVPVITPAPADLATLRARVEEIETLVAGARANEDLKADVAVYAKAGRFLLEFPQTFLGEDSMEQALAVAGQGVERARQLRAGQTPWALSKGRKILGYVSPLDGSVQPYGLTVPESYDGTRPARLYVWLHGRNQRLSEANFIHGFPAPNKSITYQTADVGQITLDCYGRWNNANHWAGEVDVFEAIAAVQRRYRIDPDRIILRGFSLGGAGAWHIALHHPGFFAAADIGAGTYPRRAMLSGFPPHQAGPLRIWENILDWSLNAFNLPIAAHDGENDSGASGLPPEPGVPNRGQLESSLRVRAQLEREGFPSEGEPYFLRAKGTPSIFLVSADTGHSVSPLVRRQVDAFLKEHGDRGRVSPDEIRFVTYTARYNTSHWVAVEALSEHYRRADVHARRQAGAYTVTTRNVTRLRLKETAALRSLEIDGQRIAVRPAAEITLERQGAAWRPARPLQGLRKTPGRQGPIDDAFLEPFLLVRPTGTPWNPAAHAQALRLLERFDRVYARWYRAHPRIKDDKDVTPADFARYHVALFGDPGSNRWIARVAGRLPLRWTRQTITAAGAAFAAADHLPALIYPNPLQPSRYVVLNSGLTILEEEYQRDYSMPQWGDWAVLKVDPAAQELPPVAVAGLFDEHWAFRR